MTDVQHYRQLLNIANDASKSDIKKAYRKLAKQWHPDRFYQDAEKQRIAEEKFKQITIAYEYLIEQDEPIISAKPVWPDAKPKPVRTTGETMVATKKTDPSLYYDLGLVLAQSGKLEESLKFFGKAIKLYPDYLPALEYRYQILSKLHFENRAAADRRKIRELKREQKDQC